MQYELTETSQHVSQLASSPSTRSSSQHGFRRIHPHAIDGLPLSRSRSSSPQSVSVAGASSSDGFDADQLEERLRRLSHGSHRSFISQGRPAVAGQRVFDYENALTPSTPRQALGFKVIRRSQSPSHGVQLTDFPNEILTHILSHLHPDSHAAVALVSKRFYALVTTSHAWRMAFLRFFPGQDVLLRSAEKVGQGPWDEQDPDLFRSETRYFSRLSLGGSWRREYLLRTHLLRSVARGKPGPNIGGVGSSRAAGSGKKATAVLTYNSKLPWMASNLHAMFSNGKKPPKVISGTADFGIGTSSDPTIGKVDKWGLDDPFAFAQLDEVFPNLEQYGLGDGPAAVPNVMDVSQPYGILGGEGFPGGRVYYRASSDLRGRYLGHDSAIIDMVPEIPKIPELSEAVCSVWIAKSPAVPSVTNSMVGIMSGSSLGVVTTYALGYEASGSRYTNGEMTARWVLSPGVPIVAIKVDDNYNQRRKFLRRVWAVALNSLGEVYYLRDIPTPPETRAKGDDVTRVAWMSGRSAYWELIGSTRRRARPDEFDKNAIRGAYSPRSPSNSMHLSKSQIIAEAREIEKFLRHKPAHFRKACDGWDMRRRLEVDFAGGDDRGGGEGIFVITCGHEKGEAAGVARYARRAASEGDSEQTEDGDGGGFSSGFGTGMPSLFGGRADLDHSLASPAFSASDEEYEEEIDMVDSQVNGTDEWAMSVYEVKQNLNAEITASAVDSTTYAVMAPFEDSLLTGSGRAKGKGPDTPTPTAKRIAGEIPGRRARLFAIGTNSGAVFVWNMRASDATTTIKPLRTIQTDSPEISCLALSALYIIHGGSDSLVQAWDPLASTLDPIRTLNAKSSGRVPRHIINANPALRHANYSAVGAIFLDPEPCVLRGVLCFGTFIRYWSYNSTNPSPGRKRRLRHSDIHGRLASRRLVGTVSGYIAAEEAELRREQELRAREQTRLRNRFGIGLGDLTEDEAIKYAEMMSQESFQLDEQRRFSTSDTGSAADIGEMASSAGSSSVSSTDTLTPEPSVSGRSSVLPVLEEETEDDYEAQIQRAIRLSLMEGVNDAGQSPRGNSSGDYEFSITVKEKKKKRKGSAGSPPVSSEASRSYVPVVQHVESNCVLSSGMGRQSSAGVDPDEDLELALRLSLEEEEERQARVAAIGLGILEDDFPPLEVKGKGKEKGVEA